MQIYHTDARGVVDSFVITSQMDNHNGLELEFKWRVLIIDSVRNALNFIKKLDERIKIDKEFSGLTIPCNVYSNVSDFAVHHPNTHGYIILISEDVDMEIIAHECYHAAYSSVENVISKKNHEVEQQEMIAYLTGQFTNSFVIEYGNRKHRAGFFRTKPVSKSKKGVRKSSQGRTKGSK